MVAVVADNWLIVCFASIFFNIFAFPCCYYLAVRTCCRRCCLCTATEGQLIVATTVSDSTVPSTDSPLIVGLSINFFSVLSPTPLLL